MTVPQIGAHGAGLSKKAVSGCEDHSGPSGSVKIQIFVFTIIQSCLEHESGASDWGCEVYCCRRPSRLSSTIRASRDKIVQHNSLEKWMSAGQVQAMWRIFPSSTAFHSRARATVSLLQLARVIRSSVQSQKHTVKNGTTVLSSYFDGVDDTLLDDFVQHDLQVFSQPCEGHRTWTAESHVHFSSEYDADSADGHCWAFMRSPIIVCSTGVSPSCARSPGNMLLYLAYTLISRLRSMPGRTKAARTWIPYRAMLNAVSQPHRTLQDG